MDFNNSPLNLHNFNYSPNGSVALKYDKLLSEIESSCNTIASQQLSKENLNQEYNKFNTAWSNLTSKFQFQSNVFKDEVAQEEIEFIAQVVKSTHEFLSATKFSKNNQEIANFFLDTSQSTKAIISIVQRKILMRNDVNVLKNHSKTRNIRLNNKSSKSTKAELIFKSEVEETQPGRSRKKRKRNDDFEDSELKKKKVLEDKEQVEIKQPAVSKIELSQQAIINPKAMETDHDLDETTIYKETINDLNDYVSLISKMSWSSRHKQLNFKSDTPVLDLIDKYENFLSRLMVSKEDDLYLNAVQTIICSKFEKSLDPDAETFRFESDLTQTLLHGILDSRKYPKLDASGVERVCQTLLVAFALHTANLRNIYELNNRNCVEAHSGSELDPIEGVDFNYEILYDDFSKILNKLKQNIENKCLVDNDEYKHISGRKSHNEIRSIVKQKTAKKAITQKLNQLPEIIVSRLQEEYKKENAEELDRTIENRRLEFISVLENIERPYQGVLKNEFSGVLLDENKNSIQDWLFAKDFDQSIDFNTPRSSLDQIPNPKLKCQLQSFGAIYSLFVESHRNFLERPSSYSAMTNYERALNRLCTNLHLIKNSCKSLDKDSIDNTKAFLLLLGAKNQQVFFERRLESEYVNILAFLDESSTVSKPFDKVVDSQTSIPNAGVPKNPKKILTNLINQKIDHFKIRMREHQIDNFMFYDEFQSYLELLPSSIKSTISDYFDKILFNNMSIFEDPNPKNFKKLEKSLKNLVILAENYDQQVVSVIMDCTSSILVAESHNILESTQMSEQYALFFLKLKQVLNSAQECDEQIWNIEQTLENERIARTLKFQPKGLEVAIEQAKELESQWEGDRTTLKELKEIGNNLIALKSKLQSSETLNIEVQCSSIIKAILNIKQQVSSLSSEQANVVKGFLNIYFDVFFPIFEGVENESGVNLEEYLSQLLSYTSYVGYERDFSQDYLDSEKVTKLLNGIQYITNKVFQVAIENNALDDIQIKNLNLVLVIIYNKMLYLASPKDFTRFYRVLIDQIKLLPNTESLQPLSQALSKSLKKICTHYIANNIEYDTVGSRLLDIVGGSESEDGSSFDKLDSIIEPKTINPDLLSLINNLSYDTLELMSYQSFQALEEGVNYLSSDKELIRLVRFMTSSIRKYMDIDDLTNNDLLLAHEHLKLLKENVDGHICHLKLADSLYLIEDFEKANTYIQKTLLFLDENIKSRNIALLNQPAPFDNLGIGASSDDFINEILNVDFIQNLEDQMDIDSDQEMTDLKNLMAERSELVNDIKEFYEAIQIQPMNIDEVQLSNNTPQSSLMEDMNSIEMDHGYLSLKEGVSHQTIQSFKQLPNELRLEEDDKLNLRRRYNILSDTITIKSLEGGIHSPRQFYSILESSLGNVSPQAKSVLMSYKESFVRAQELVDSCENIYNGLKEKKKDSDWIEFIESERLKLSNRIISEYKEALKSGKSLIIPAGIEGIHATYIFLEKSSEGGYIASYVNSGSGLDFHPRSHIDGKDLFLPSLDVHVSDEWLDSMDFDFLLETTISLKFVAAKKQKESCDMDDPYRNFLTCTKDFLLSNTAQTHSPDEFITPQRSGTCSYQCNESLLRTILNRHVRDPYLNYKVLISDTKMNVFKDHFNETLLKFQSSLKDVTFYDIQNEFHKDLYLLETTLPRISQKVSKLYRLSIKNNNKYNGLVSQHLKDLLFIKNALTHMQEYRREALMTSRQFMPEIKDIKCSQVKVTPLSIQDNFKPVEQLTTFNLQSRIVQKIKSLPKSTLVIETLSDLKSLRSCFSELYCNGNFFETKCLITDLIKTLPLSMSGKGLSIDEYKDFCFLMHELMDMFFGSIVNEKLQTGITPIQMYTFSKLSNILNTVQQSSDLDLESANDCLIGMQGIPYQLFSSIPSDKNYSGGYQVEDPQIRKEIELLSKIESNKLTFRHLPDLGINLPNQGINGVLDVSIEGQNSNSWTLNVLAAMKKKGMEIDESDPEGQVCQFLEDIISDKRLQEQFPLFNSTLRWFTYASFFSTRLAYRIEEDYSFLSLPVRFYYNQEEGRYTYKINDYILKSKRLREKVKNQTKSYYGIDHRSIRSLAFFENNPIEDWDLGRFFNRILMERECGSTPFICSMLGKNSKRLNSRMILNTPKFIELTGSYENRVGLLTSFFESYRELLKDSDYQKIFEFLLLEDQCLENSFYHDPESIACLNAFLNKEIERAIQVGDMSRVKFFIRTKNAVFKLYDNEKNQYLGFIDALISNPKDALSLIGRDELNQLLSDIGLPDLDDTYRPLISGNSREAVLKYFRNNYNPLAPSKTKLLNSGNLSNKTIYYFSQALLNDINEIDSYSVQDIKINSHLQFANECIDYLSAYQEKAVFNHARNHSFLESIALTFESIIDEEGFWNFFDNSQPIQKHRCYLAIYTLFHLKNRRGIAEDSDLDGIKYSSPIIEERINKMISSAQRNINQYLIDNPSQNQINLDIALFMLKCSESRLGDIPRTFHQVFEDCFSSVNLKNHFYEMSVNESLASTYLFKDFNNEVTYTIDPTRLEVRSSADSFKSIHECIKNHAIFQEFFAPIQAQLQVTIDPDYEGHVILNDIKKNIKYEVFLGERNEMRIFRTIKTIDEHGKESNEIYRYLSSSKIQSPGINPAYKLDFLMVESPFMNQWIETQCKAFLRVSENGKIMRRFTETDLILFNQADETQYRCKVNSKGNILWDQKVKKYKASDDRLDYEGNFFPMQNSFNILKRVEHPSFIHIISDQDDNAQTIEMPRFNLSLRCTRDQGKLRLEIDGGFYLSPNQECEALSPYNEYLIFQNDLGERKILFPIRGRLGSNSTQTGKVDPLIDITQPEYNLSSSNVTCVEITINSRGKFNIENSIQAFFLSNLYLNQKQYKQANHYLSSQYIPISIISPTSIEMLNTISTSNPLDDFHPDAISIRLKALYHKIILKQKAVINGTSDTLNLEYTLEEIEDIKKYFNIRLAMESFALMPHEEAELLRVYRDYNTLSSDLKEWVRFYQSDESDIDLLTSIKISHVDDEIPFIDPNMMHFRSYDLVGKRINNRPFIPIKNLDKVICEKEDLINHLNYLNSVSDSDAAYYKQMLIYNISREKSFEFTGHIKYLALLYLFCINQKQSNQGGQRFRQILSEAIHLSNLPSVQMTKKLEKQREELLKFINKQVVKIVTNFTSQVNSTSHYLKPHSIRPEAKPALKREHIKKFSSGSAERVFKPSSLVNTTNNLFIVNEPYTSEELYVANSLIASFTQVAPDQSVLSSLHKMRKSSDLLTESLVYSKDKNNSDPVAVKEYNNYMQGIRDETERLEQVAKENFYALDLSTNQIHQAINEVVLNRTNARAQSKLIAETILESFQAQLESIGIGGKTKSYLKGLTSDSYMPSILDLQQLLAQGILDTELKDTYAMTDEQSEEIKIALRKFSYFSRKANSYDRVADKLTDLAKGKGTLSILEETKLRNEIYTELEAVFNRGDNHPIESDDRLILIEEFCGFRIREEQQDLINSLINNPDSRQVHQMIMGFGKTSVIALAVLMVYAYNPSNPSALLVIPESLKPQMAEFFREMEGSVFGGQVSTEKYSESIDQQIERTRSIHDRIIKSKRIIHVMDKKDILGSCLRFINSLSKKSFMRFIRNILVDLSGKQALFDEIDTLLNASETINMPAADAKEKKLSSQEINVPSFFYGRLLDYQKQLKDSKETYSVIYDFSNTKGDKSLTKESFNQFFKKSLTNDFIDELFSLAENPNDYENSFYSVINQNELESWASQINSLSELDRNEHMNMIKLYLQQASANDMMNKSERLDLIDQNLDSFFLHQIPGDSIEEQKAYFQNNYLRLFSEPPESLTDEEIDDAINFILERVPSLQDKIIQMQSPDYIIDVMALPKEQLLEEHFGHIESEDQKLAERFMLQLCSELGLRKASKYIDSDAFMLGVKIDAMNTDSEEEQNSLKDLFAVARFQIVDLLPKTLTTKCYNSFGFSSNPSIFHALPCKDGNVLESSLFSSPHETFNFTAQLFIRQGVSDCHIDYIFNQLAAHEQSMIEAHYAESSESADFKIDYSKVPFLDILRLLSKMAKTAEGADLEFLNSLLKNFDSSSVVFQNFAVNKQDKRKLLDIVNKNNNSRLKFAEIVAGPSITYKDKELSLTASDLIRIIKKVSGFAGTQAPAVSDTMATYYDARIDAETMMTLSMQSLGVIQERTQLPLEEQLEGILRLGVGVDETLFQSSIQGEPSGSWSETVKSGSIAKAIIDVGGIFNGKDPKEVVKTAWSVQSRIKPSPQPPIKSIFFHDLNNVLMAYDGKSFQTADSVVVAKESRITFYFQKNTVGVDIKQAMDANGIITASSDTTLNAYLQGAKRFRGLGQNLGRGQRLGVYLNYETSSVIRGGVGKTVDHPLTTEDVLRYAIDMNVNDAKKQMDMHIIQEVQAVAKELVLQFYTSNTFGDFAANRNNKDTDFLSELNSFFEKTISGSSYDRLGIRNTLQDSIKVLNGLIDQLTTNIEQAFGKIPQELLNNFIKEYYEENPNFKSFIDNSGINIKQENITTLLSNYKRNEMVDLLNKKAENNKLNSTMYTTSRMYFQTSIQSQQQQQQSQQQSQQQQQQQQQQFESETRCLSNPLYQFKTYENQAGDYFEKEYYQGKNPSRHIVAYSFKDDKLGDSLLKSNSPTSRFILNLDERVVWANTMFNHQDNLNIKLMDWNNHFQHSHKSLEMIELRFDSTNHSNWLIRASGVDEAEEMKVSFKEEPPIHDTKSIQILNLHTVNLSQLKESLISIKASSSTINELMCEIAKLKVAAGVKLNSDEFNALLGSSPGYPFESKLSFEDFLNDMGNTFWYSNPLRENLKTYYRELYQ